MEEILSSIRRIIADDEEETPARESQDTGPAPVNSTPLHNVLDLAEHHAAPEALPRKRETASSWGEFEEPGAFAAGGSAMETPARPAAMERKIGPVSGAVEDEGLLSCAAQASVAEAFDRLGAALMPSQPRTLEDLMREMLRPMLKAWLDENLPDIVERLVRAEIERVARGRR